jgi:hypothetical protein
LREKLSVKAVAYYSVIAVIAIMLLSVSKTWLIISIGIVAANALIAAGWGVAAVAFVAGSAFFLLQWLKSRRLYRASAPFGNPSMQEEQNQAVIRSEITRLQNQRPKLKRLLSHGLSQMHSIDRKQASLKEILTRNDAAHVGEVASTLDSAEQAVCKNLIRVINRAVLWDPLEASKPGKEQIYEEHVRYMEQILEKNEAILTMCDTMLSEAVSFLGERKGSADEGAAELAAMTETLQSLRAMNGADE